MLAIGEIHRDQLIALSHQLGTQTRQLYDPLLWNSARLLRLCSRFTARLPSRTTRIAVRGVRYVSTTASHLRAHRFRPCSPQATRVRVYSTPHPCSLHLASQRKSASSPIVLSSPCNSIPFQRRSFGSRELLARGGESHGSSASLTLAPGTTYSIGGNSGYLVPIHLG